MTTDAAIAAMALDLQPVRRHALGGRLLVGMLGGGLATMAAIAMLLGFRSDLPVAVHGFAFWMKWAYTMTLGIAAIAMTARLARPEPVRLNRFWPLILPVAALAVVSTAQLARVPPGDWRALWLGRSWTMCPLLVLTLSLPIFAGLLWSFRRLAPTRLRAAGAAAGLSAGAWSATLYGLHCPEVSPVFVLTWYSLGIGLAAGLGALVGPRVLRW